MAAIKQVIRGQWSILERDQVIEIVNLLAGGMSQYEIAAIYGVDQCTISLIHQNKIWKDVPRPLPYQREIPRGEKIGTAKLGEMEVREIKQALATGERPSHLAKRYGVSVPAITKIRDGKSWTHI
jgi:hypothetical protein